MRPYEDPALLAELFTYDPATGRVFHAKDKRTGRGAGRIVASAGDYADTYTISDGYRLVSVRIGGKKHQPVAHRVAWILTHGTIPDGLQVDHVNGVRDDNRIFNLRLLTPHENQHNRHTAKGYCWRPRHGKWCARIQVGGRQIHLGNHGTEDEARAAYLTAKRIYHPTAPVELYQ